MIELRLLGSVELGGSHRQPGETVLAQPKRLALLAYLAAARPAGFHRRDKLLAMFWPEAPAAAARVALNQAFSFIRRHLGPDVLVVRGHDEIAIDPRAVWCDARAFVERLDGGDAPAALALYRGSLLDGLHVRGCPGFERWLDDERSDLQRRAAACAWEAADLASSSGDDRTAAEWGRRAHGLAPLDEPGVRRLMTLLSAMGDRAGAMEAYGDFVTRMETELELPPSPETIGLAARLREAAAASRDPPNRAPELRRRSIAVLPFRTLTPPPETELHLIDGIHEQLISELAKRPAFQVIGRTSVKPYLDDESPADRAGRRLGVDLVVETAAARVEPDGWRVTLRLLDVRSGTVLWGGTYEGPHVRTIHLSAARSIARALDAPGEADEQVVRLPRPSAYNEYLLGRFHWNRFHTTGLRTAVRHLERAVELDPAYAAAHAALAGAFAMLGIAHGEMPAREAFSRVRRHAERALQLEPALAAGHAWLGFYELFFGWDFQAAEQHLERSIAYGGETSDAYRHLAFCRGWTGRHREAIACALRAIDLDPVAPISYGDAGVQHYYARRYPEAVRFFRESLELEPGFHPSHWGLGETYLAMGRISQGVAHLEKAYAGAGTAAFLGTLALGHARAGRSHSALEILDALTAASSAQPELAAVMALVHVGLGDHERALDSLERACEVRSVYLPHVLSLPLLGELRRHDRCQRVARRVGLGTDVPPA